jgi:hypothetical protein
VVDVVGGTVVDVVGGTVDVVVRGIVVVVNRVGRGGWLKGVPELQEESTIAAPSANVRLMVVVGSLLRARSRLLVVVPGV